MANKERIVSSTNGVGKTVYPYVKEENCGFILYYV